MKREEREAKQRGDMDQGQGYDSKGAEDSGTETEGADTKSDEGVLGTVSESQSGRHLKPEDAQSALRKRRSSGGASSGDLSTDSDWDKLSEAEEVGR